MTVSPWSRSENRSRRENRLPRALNLMTQIGNLGCANRGRSISPTQVTTILPSTAMCEVPWVTRDRAGRDIPGRLLWAVQLNLLRSKMLGVVSACESPPRYPDRAGRHITPVISRDVGRPIPAAGNQGAGLKPLTGNGLGR